MRVVFETEARAQLRTISMKCDYALAESTKVFGLLDQFERVSDPSSHYHWNSMKGNPSYLVSVSELRNKAPIWRLFPSNIHCIALLVERDGVIHVEAFCSSEDICEAEMKLIDDC